MFLILKSLIFLLCTAAIIYTSRASLRQPGSHGFYRFFAWEAILLLGFLNMDAWFYHPLAWNQLISWLLLIISLYLVLQAVLLLKQKGEQDSHRQDSTLLGLEKTTRLVVSGVYRYIRHPLYSSLLFLAWGIFFKRTGIAAGWLALVATLFLILTANAEEQEDIAYFGQAYRDYMERTRRFIPFIY